MIQLLFSEPNPGPVKAALAMQGEIQDELRLPMTRMTATGKVKLAKTLEKLMTIPVAGKTAQPKSAIRGNSRLLGLVR